MPVYGHTFNGAFHMPWYCSTNDIIDKFPAKYYLVPWRKSKTFTVTSCSNFCATYQFRTRLEYVVGGVCTIVWRAPFVFSRATEACGCGSAGVAWFQRVNFVPIAWRRNNTPHGLWKFLLAYDAMCDFNDLLSAVRKILIDHSIEY